ncbi:MAG: hypothetical protein M1831_005105 [Alyxoria varia]|nr:MAG: hypothetical protein M1831_005105 [Alyxoria varia]
MASIKIGLGVRKKNALAESAKPTPGKRKAMFSEESDDEDGPLAQKQPSNDAVREITTLDDDTAVGEPSSPQPASIRKSATSAKPKPPPNLSSSNCQTLSSRLSQSTIQSTATNLDASIYDYDSFHSTSSSALAAARRKKAEDAAGNTDDAISGGRAAPKYMTNMHASAELRKQDQLQARDKQLQREREAEGEDFAEKEKFVTEAYKAQQEEVRRAEEAEKRKEEGEAKKREGRGMRGFYENVLREEEERYKAVVEAAEKVPTTEAKDDEDEEILRERETEAAELAKKMNAQGGNVLVNEEGQVTDKRELLQAGLNITAKPKPNPQASTSSTTAQSRQASQDTRDQQPLQGQVSGRKDAKRAMRERQSRMLEAQLEQQNKRAAEEEAEKSGEQQKKVKSGKTEGDISSAKERYLARKREAEAAKKAGLDPL